MKPPRLASTPSKEIHAENKLRVLHYIPTAPTLHVVPILIVSSLINKYYILDLIPGKSYVEYLLEKGFSVYLVDWGTPADEDRSITLEDHIAGYLPTVVSRVLEHAKARKLSMVGYCMGGTMALIYVCLYPQFVKNLVLLGTPVDFHNDSLLSLWGRPEYFDVDKLIDTYGNAPAEILYGAFMMLKPTKNITKYMDLLRNLHDKEYVETFHAFNYWVRDAVPVPGETFRKFVKDTYQSNLLVQGRMALGKRLVNLKNVACPVLNVAAEQDGIIPLMSTTALMGHISSEDKTLLTIVGGHHGLSVGPMAQRVVWPRTVEWLALRSED